MAPSVLRYAQRIDPVVFGVRADEFHERDLPTEIEGHDQPIISPGDFKAHALAIEHLRFRHSRLYIFSRGPLRGFREPEPPLQRAFGFRMSCPERNEDIPGDDPHRLS